MKQERARSNAGMQPASEEAQEQRSAKSQVDVASIVEARNKLSVEDSVGERGNRQDETYERTGRTDVKERPGGANRGTDQNERAERTHQ